MPHLPHPSPDSLGLNAMLTVFKIKMTEGRWVEKSEREYSAKEPVGSGPVSWKENREKMSQEVQGVQCLPRR